MGLIHKADAPAQSLPMEVVPVQELGGDVVVRGLMLRQRLAILQGTRDGADDFAHICRLLAVCVFDADDRQLYSADEWEVFGAKHFEAAVKLFNVASRLVGADHESAVKN